MEDERSDDRWVGAWIRLSIFFYQLPSVIKADLESGRFLIEPALFLYEDSYETGKYYYLKTIKR